jgi:hypothetical protein
MLLKMFPQGVNQLFFNVGKLEKMLQALLIDNDTLRKDLVKFLIE